MKLAYRLSWLFGWVASLAFVFGFAANADHGWRSADNVQYRWANDFIRVVDSVPSTWDKPIYAAARDWTRGAVDLGVVAGRNSPACAAITGAVRICKGKYGQTGWAGLTNLEVDGHGTILSARVRLNATYLLSSASRRAATCHELGHAIGLTHHQQSDSCLTAVLDSRRPNAHDYEQLEVIY